MKGKENPERMIAYRLGQAKKEIIHGKAVDSQFITVFYKGVSSGLKLAWYDVTGKIWKEGAI